MSEIDAVKQDDLGRSLVKGLVAGLIGGLVATAAKTIAEKIYPPLSHGESEPSAMLAEKIVGRDLTAAQETFAVETIHWGFGALTGAAYGALAEFYPAATAKDGAGFGLALASLTHGAALPEMGSSVPPEEQTSGERAGDVASHAFFGIVTETVRRSVRKFLD